MTLRILLIGSYYVQMLRSNVHPHMWEDLDLFSIIIYVILLLSMVIQIWLSIGIVGSLLWTKDELCHMNIVGKK